MLQNILRETETAIMVFGREQREEEQHHYKNASRSDISTLLRLLSPDAKSAVFMRVLSLTKVEVCNFPLLTFPRWLCLIHEQFDVSATCEKVGHM